VRGRARDSETARPESLFRRLGKQHAHTWISGISIFDKPLASETLKRLRQIHRLLQNSDHAREQHPAASEWFLDNYYLVMNATAICRESLVSDFYKRLPDIADASEDGTPRIFLLACELLAAGELQLDEQVLRRLLRAYQTHAPLTVAEIWALPIMLRLILLGTVVSSMAGLLEDQLSATGDVVPHCPRLELEAETTISRSIRALHLLATVDWNAFFDGVSRLEAELARDPAGVYARMDFRTRDHYRKVVEELAWRTGRDEADVARYLVATAQRAPPADGRRRHIGHYLIDRGRGEIERRLGFRPARAERVRRSIRRHATAWYLSSIALAVSVFMTAPLWLLARDPPPLATSLLLVFLVLVPAWSFAIALVQWLITRIFAPQILPRMDFSKGISRAAKTAVAVPALLVDADVIKQLIHDLEVRYLSNPDPNLCFALLTDFVDASEKEVPRDKELLALAEAGIEALNHVYAKGPRDTFYLLHRERQWSEGEEIWKGWERKRGKIIEFNRWILGDGHTSFAWHVGNTRELQGIRFVITLDADTMLPKGAAADLAGIMAHPLNAAEFDPQSSRVVAGYTVVQPRVEIDPASQESSAFTRIVAGDIGIDPYAHAVSDAYQDLFGTGIYVGKGIYDVASFTACLAQIIPPRRVLSHDLLEGVLGRAGLASDISVYEHFPPHYIAYTRRLHRWIRGDWQLIRWLFPRVPVSGGRLASNPLQLIDRWKIFENLRRSLFFPLLFAFLVASWLLAPSALLAWTLLGAFAPGAHLLAGIASRVVGGFRRSEQQSMWASVRSLGRTDIKRWLLSISFTCHLAVVAVDAIARALTRVFITRRRLLEWVTFSTASGIGQTGSLRKTVWLEVGASTLMAMAALFSILIFRPAALAYSAPFLMLWIAAPELARWLSVAPEDFSPAPLDQDDQTKLRELAFRTWHFFEAFVEPNSHWLPPDHFQESPRGEVAQRTSPTNIAMMFLATLVARDLGFVGIANFVQRLRYSMDTLTRMPRYRGHILNWVDTSTLEPLEPRYVSTVDSGNLAGALITLRQACLEIDRQPILRESNWQALADILGLLEKAVSRLLHRANIEAPECVDTIRHVRALIRQRDQSNLGHAALIAQLERDTCKRLNTQILNTLRQVHGGEALVDLEEIETWANALNEHVESMHLEAETYLPWLQLLLAPPDMARSHEDCALQPAWQTLRDAGQAPIRLADTDPAIGRLRVASRAWQEQWGATPPPEAEAWMQAFNEALDKGAKACRSIREGLQALTSACARELEDMDFSLLYDARRMLFHIGYNVSESRLDPHHYDLIASESRLASFIAIARGAAPTSHWWQMARPTVRRGGTPVLLSWTGTMFEYLMPPLLMRSNHQTLLSRSCEMAVQQQIAYAGKLDVPWGISESGYYRFDPSLKYQYQAFGVPMLGLKRGLDDDLVIAPYASLLAISLRPQAVMENIRHLENLGALGRFGLYEALDFTAERMRSGRRFQIVRSYMAHHQGMIMCALGNYLHSPTLPERFHADPTVRSAEFLLNEQVPLAPTTQDIQPRRGQSPKITHLPSPPLQSWSPAAEATVPQINLLSNGRLTTRITNYGAGDLQWSGLSLSRWRPDSTRDQWGYWIYLRDEENRRAWSVTPGPDSDGSEEHRAVFFPHKTEFSRRTDGLFVRTEIYVAAGEDVEIRRLEIQNESPRLRKLSLTSYAEIVMADPRSDEAHPAFEKLFTQARHDADFDMLEFHRRRRNPDEQPVVLAHRGFSESPANRRQGYETDRGRFLGRGADASQPAALAGDGLSGIPGNTLDPILCVQVSVTLAPYTSATVNFLTGVAESSESVRKSMRRYPNDASCRWALQESMVENRRELAAIGMNPSGVGDVQRLFSELQYPDGMLRSNPKRSNARAQQPALWPLGISGDYPILLLELRDTGEMALLETLLRAHHFWRTRGQHVDLVILNHEASTYGSVADGRVQRAVTRCHGREWLSRRGGIYIVDLDQVSATDCAQLQASAMAVLDSDHGSLAHQLRQRDNPIHHLPRLSPTLAPLVDQPESIHLQGLQYENDFGGFSADGREYIVYVEDGRRPPAPWSNVLANPRFGCLTTESGGGYTWFLNAGEYRLTPWSNDPVSDPAGECLYLRDEQTVQVWSPLPLPGQSGSYRTHHGAGYTRYVHHSHQLEQETRQFVPPDDTVKLIQVRLKNLAHHPRRITATYYAEWVLGAQRSQTQSHILTEFDTRLKAILASCAWNPDFGSCVAFLASSNAIHGFTGDRKEFLGRYGSVARPAALGRTGLAGSRGQGLDPCAALQIHLDLDSNEEVTFHFVLGAAADRNAAAELCAKYSRAAADAAWQRVHDHWDELLGTIVVSTPEPAMDLLLNRWLLYQTLSSRIFARTGFYQSSGAYGFRDQLQDSMALLQVRPALARAQILEAARRQFDSGDVLHWWHPPSGKGVRTRCSDDLLWLPYVTSEYVDITGDTQILDETVAFLCAPPLRAEEEDRYGAFEAGAESATLLEHCRRAINKGLTTGPNGLPLIAGGDWNDAMNRVGIEGRGESVWLAWFACATARRFLTLCQAAGEATGDEKIEKWIASVQEALQQKAWDGAWYRRAFYDDGTVIGSAESAQCRIDSISQSWATLSRLPVGDRAERALESALEHLVNEEQRIVALLTPPFDGEGHDPGYIKAYPPGVRENGGQYTHASVWLAWALAEQGDGDRAEWLFRLLNPVLRGIDRAAVERYRVEPYVLAADIYTSPEHPGRGGWTWYTGSSAWLWRFGIEGLLGLRRSGGTLIFDPCIPSAWPGFSATISIKGASTRVEVRNPHARCHGVYGLELDDRVIASNRVDLDEAAGRHIVVHMGDRPITR
jgi:cyclic beta-1,2-glucan synthetase